MRLLVNTFALLFTLTLLSACNSNKAKPLPNWINDPGDGAVGSSSTHIRGRHYQEELAISRARERLAARYGVEVASIQTIRERVVNDKSYVTSDKEILQQVNKTTVKAHVREIFYDTAHDEIWAWVYPIAN